MLLMASAGLENKKVLIVDVNSPRPLGRGGTGRGFAPVTAGGRHPCGELRGDVQIRVNIYSFKNIN
jgi:hypothetical protein